MKHKHYDLIVAWANGAKIEWYNVSLEKWVEVESPRWEYQYTYRIKKNIIIDKYVELYTPYPKGEPKAVFEIFNCPNVRFTFDPCSSELISVEKI